MKKQTKKTAKIAKTNKTVKAATAKPKRVRKPRTEAQKARRRELAAMKRAAKKDYVTPVFEEVSKPVSKAVKAEPCKCAKAGEFLRAMKKLIAKYGI